MLDVLIHDGTIRDEGGRNNAVEGAFDITGDRISAFGRLASASARLTLATARAAVAPGFIDLQSHANLAAPDSNQRVPSVAGGVREKSAIFSSSSQPATEGAAHKARSPATLEPANPLRVLCVATTLSRPSSDPHARVEDVADSVAQQV